MAGSIAPSVAFGGEEKPERNLDIHLYLGAPVPNTIYNWLRTLSGNISSRILVNEGLGSEAVMDEFDRECRTYPGKIFVSELGYGGMSDLIETISKFEGREDLLDARELKTLQDSLLEGFAQRHLDQIFGSPQGLFREAQKLQALGNTQQLEAVLSNPRISGYVITQFNDVAWEFHAGLLDLWRNPKLAYYAAQRLNRPYLIVLHARQAAAHLHDRVDIDLSLVCRDPSSSTHGVISIQVTSPLGEVIAREEVKIQINTGIHTLETISIEVGLAGVYRISAELIANGKTLAENEETILAMERINWGILPQQFRSFGKEPPIRLLGDHPQTDAKTNTGLYLAAYPSSLTVKDWANLLALVHSGGVAICGALCPEDQLAVQILNRHDLPVQLHPGIGSWMGCYHWIPDTNLFTGLPAGGLAMKPYAEIVPKYVLSEMGGQVQAGSLRNTQSRLEAPAMLWYSDIESVQFGKGEIVFCQYRVFEKIDRDPLADRLAANLLHYANQLFGNGIKVI